MIRERIELTPKKQRRVRADLVSVLGEHRVHDESGVLVAYSGVNALFPRAMPHFVVRPLSTEEVVEIVRIASRHRIPLTPVSSGTQEPGTHPFFGGIVLDLRGMNRILEVDPERFYAVVEPGVTVGALARELAKHRLHLTVGSFPPSLSVLGNYLQVAVNSHRSSGINHDILALEVVLADGTVMRTGSKAFAERFPHVSWFCWTNSFPSLTELFINAQGTLGIVTKGAVKVYQVSEVHDTILTAFPSYRQSVEFMKDLARNNLVQHVCAWHWCLYTIIDHLEQYGHGASSEVVVYDPWETPDDRPYNIVVPTFSGYREQVEGVKAAIRRLIEKHGGRDYTEECREKYPGAHKFFYDHYVHHQPTNTFMGAYAEGYPVMPIVLCDPTTVADLEDWGLKFLRSSILKLGLAYYSHCVDMGRTIFLRMTPVISPDSSQRQIQRAARVRARYMETAMRKFGAVPIRPAPDGGQTLKQTGGFGQALIKIKKALDPQNIMNAGMSAGMYGSSMEEGGGD